MSETNPPTPTPVPVKGKFSLGECMATPAALMKLSEVCADEDTFNIEVAGVMARHVNGDWGDVDAHDRKANDEAIAHEGDPDLMSRVMSVYDIRGVRVWVITEADRSATTLLLPENY